MSTKNRKSSNPAKTLIAAKKPGTAKSRKTSTLPVSTDASTEASGLVKVHDMTGWACVSLPTAVHDILGEEEYRSLLTALEGHFMTMIIRGPNDIIYLDMPFMVFGADSASASSQSEVTPPAQAKPTRKKASRN